MTATLLSIRTRGLPCGSDWGPPREGSGDSSKTDIFEHRLRPRGFGFRHPLGPSPPPVLPSDSVAFPLSEAFLVVSYHTGNVPEDTESACCNWQRQTHLGSCRAAWLHGTQCVNATWEARADEDGVWYLTRASYIPLQTTSYTQLAFSQNTIRCRVEDEVTGRPRA
uniref:Uncharacterized protein n=1 Tax=Eutreptiella gymnastica TaxID=73025 RepID=A0A6U8P9B9_9EUGL